MNELLRKLYDDVISNEDDTLKVGNRLDAEVKELVEPYTNCFSEDDMETIKNLMYSILLTGEQEGFHLGVKSTIKILMEIFGK